MNKYSPTQLLVAMVLAAIGGTAAGEDELWSPVVDEQAGGSEPSLIAVDEWEIELTPYMFVPFKVEGDSTIGGVKVAINLDLLDILDNFDLIAFSTLVEVRKADSDWGLFANFALINLDSDDFTLRTPLPGGPTGTITVEIRQISSLTLALLSS